MGLPFLRRVPKTREMLWVSREWLRENENTPMECSLAVTASSHAPAKHHAAPHVVLSSNEKSHARWWSSCDVVALDLEAQEIQVSLCLWCTRLASSDVKKLTRLVSVTPIAHEQLSVMRCPYSCRSIACPWPQSVLSHVALWHLVVHLQSTHE